MLLMELTLHSTWNPFGAGADADVLLFFFVALKFHILLVPVLALKIQNQNASNALYKVCLKYKFQ